MLVDELVQKITVKADAKALDVVQKKEEKLIATTNTLVASFKSAFKWVGGTLLLKSIVDANVSMDTLNKSFVALAGSSKSGAEQIAYLRKEADRLGQDFPTIANAYKNFFAVGKGANISTGETQSIFTSILEASTVLGSSTQSTEGALLAIEQMISKGKVSMEELRRQLGNALPGAMQIASKAMGVTSAEFEKLLAKGMPSLDFVRKFSAELQKNYSGEKLAGPVRSLRAELTRLKNALFFMKTDLLGEGGNKALAQAVREITNALTSDSFKFALKMIGNALALILKNAKLIFVLWGGNKLIQFVKGIKAVKDAVMAFNIVYAITGSLTSTLTTGLVALKVGFFALSKSVWLAIAPFLKFATAVLMVEDIWKTFTDKNADTLTRRAGESTAGFLQEQQGDSVWKYIGRSLVDAFGGQVGKLFAPSTPESNLNLSLPSQAPAIEVNQKIEINNGMSPAEVTERTKMALDSAFRQLQKRGA